MKNLLKISLVFVALLLVVTTVNAATASEFVAYVSSAKTIAGQSVTLVTAAQKAEIERYLAKNDVSESDLDYLKGKFDEGVAVMDAAGVTDYTKLSQTDKDRLVSLANEASERTGIKINFNSNGTVSIYNLDGTLFTTTGSTIKQTGSNNYAYIPVIAIVAVAIVLISKRGLANAK